MTDGNKLKATILLSKILDAMSVPPLAPPRAFSSVLPRPPVSCSRYVLLRTPNSSHARGKAVERSSGRPILTLPSPSAGSSTDNSLLTSSLACSARQTDSPPLPIFRAAIIAASPLCRLKSIRKGAKTMIVPIPLNERQRTRFGVRWLLKAADKRAAYNAEKRIAMEMLAVLDGSSNVLKMIDERHKVAMMNRCVPHRPQRSSPHDDLAQELTTCLSDPSGPTFRRTLARRGRPHDALPSLIFAQAEVDHRPGGREPAYPHDHHLLQPARC
jgi:small subunit ribosomal protein S7